jgi:SAM-dependent methyltransferase
MIIQVPMQIDDTATFYTRVDAYLNAVDPTIEAENQANAYQEEREALSPVLGNSAGQSILDLTCGWGTQAVVLASLGWQVTGLDLTPSLLDTARARAEKSGITLRLEQHDARTPIPDSLVAKFDVSISCMALDNILEEDGFTQAIANLYHALKPGGLCYVRLRNLDFILDGPSRYDFSWERKLPNGRLIRVEDFIPLTDGTLVHSYIFLLEDHSRSGYPYETSVFSYRRRALRKPELLTRLAQAGFVEVTPLPNEAPWFPYAVTARR